MTISSGESMTPQADSSARVVTRLALQYGVGIGLVCVVWMVGLQLTGNNGFGPKQLMAQLLVPLVAVASQWQLRRQLKPAKPGLGRSLGVGVLTTLLAAVVSAVGVMGLAAGAGEVAVDRHRAEVKEIVQAQQREAAKQGVSAALRQQQMQQIDHLTVGNIASSNFLQVLVLGLVLAVPAGIFLRE
ncbi:DUF4199 domain-containing protein [Hymenobacter properus]|uniref:DUF4199 domain-containing protein n=1 Tax=Hymenobacter properus TaxID=2791026 RepID=A0A931BL41_9BACT|nr:DUF4199 domain-containing protein [Hymenobacter properus]MBF9144188.1 DUF4199 domain-containing protein [Hymenobacter properus]MBR7723006.1 DUF4199 domain-containing protein [Microvirga sp. SRT04]